MRIIIKSVWTNKGTYFCGRSKDGGINGGKIRDINREVQNREKWRHLNATHFPPTNANGSDAAFSSFSFGLFFLCRGEMVRLTCNQLALLHKGMRRAGVNFIICFYL